MNTYKILCILLSLIIIILLIKALSTSTTESKKLRNEEYFNYRTVCKTRCKNHARDCIKYDSNNILVDRFVEYC
jgi:hypothetical protein